MREAVYDAYYFMLNGFLYFLFQVANCMEVKRFIEKAFHQSKSAGYKKFYHRTDDAYAGLSKRHVLKCVLRDENPRKFNVKLATKARPCPVSLREIHEQQQTDLVVTKNMAVELQAFTYQYILSVMDIFSRFHWLALLTKKRSSRVKKELQKIFKIYDIQKCLQIDNKGEFKKEVKRFCKINKIKMIRSHPCNLKSQGKLECSQQVLCCKIYYGLVQLK